MTLAVTLNNPVMNSPVVANTATLPVPPIPTVALPPELTMVILLVPLEMFEPPPPPLIPVNNDPLPIKKLPVTLPVADTNPVTYCPVVAQTITLPVPPIPTLALPPELTIVTLLVPLLILVPLPMPVSAAPLPMKYPAAILPVVLTLPDPNVAPPAVIFPVPDIVPPPPTTLIVLEAITLLLITLPVTLTNPVTYSPVVANTATLLVPPIPTATFPPEVTTVTLLVPLAIFEPPPPPPLIPVNNDPLPMK